MILAIDPGNIQSAYTFIADNYLPVRFGKVDNLEMIEIIENSYCEDIVIERIASYGMSVGQEVFDTCVWIGRFYEVARNTNCQRLSLMFRKDVKLNLCNSMRAKDSNIIQALIDRFAPNTSNKGKGVKASPGWFHGFSKDVWQSYALAVTYHDKKGEEE